MIFGKSNSYKHEKLCEYVADLPDTYSKWVFYKKLSDGTHAICQTINVDVEYRMKYWNKSSYDHKHYILIANCIDNIIYALRKNGHITKLKYTSALENALPQNIHLAYITKTETYY